MITLSPTDRDKLRSLLCSRGEEAQYLRDCAARTSEELFGRAVYLRGLIEISSYCRNNCLYCGLRRDNTSAERYRLSAEQILECCQTGYNLGLRTFVLQGGEDGFWRDSRLVPLVRTIATSYPDAAITLSLGERSTNSYKELYRAGASRYLLRHEAANRTLYEAIHPAEMSYDNRIESIKSLMEIGFQTGMGMMIGVPGQSDEDILDDIQLLATLRPQMVGIGPFIPHPATPFGNYPAGDIEKSLNAIAITRLLLPHALIPATTAIATLSKNGHCRAICAGANVVMPNLSPADVRTKYAIYSGKASFGTQAVEGIKALERELSAINYTINYSKADYNDSI